MTNYDYRLFRMQWMNRLVALVKDWRYFIQRDDWRSAAPEIFKDIARLPYLHTGFFVFTRSLLEPLPPLHPRIALKIRQFELADLESIQQIERPSEVAECAKRLARGHYGLVAQSGDKVVGYAWGCVETDLERIPVPLDSGDVLCTKAYTAPAFRGQGVQTELVLARFRRFHDLGYKRALAYIVEDNYPSLAVWRKVGGQVLGQGSFRRVGLWSRIHLDFEHLNRNDGF